MSVLLVADDTQVETAYAEAAARINGRKTRKVDDRKSDLEVGATGILTEIMLSAWLDVERDERVYTRGGDKYDLLIPGTDYTMSVKNRGAGREPVFLLVPTQDQDFNDDIGILCQNDRWNDITRMWVLGWFTMEDWDYNVRDDYQVYPSSAIPNDLGLRRGIGVEPMRDPLELKQICEALKNDPTQTIPALSDGRQQWSQRLRLRGRGV